MKSNHIACTACNRGNVITASRNGGVQYTCNTCGDSYHSTTAQFTDPKRPVMVTTYGYRPNGKVLWTESWQNGRKRMSFVNRYRTYYFHGSQRVQKRVFMKLLRIERMNALSQLGV